MHEIFHHRGHCTEEDIIFGFTSGKPNRRGRRGFAEVQEMPKMPYAALFSCRCRFVAEINHLADVVLHVGGALHGHVEAIAAVGADAEYGFDQSSDD